MKFKELKNKSVKDLRKELRHKESEMGDMRFSLYSGKKFKQVHMINLIRKDIARINTAITTRRKLIKAKKKK